LLKEYENYQENQKERLSNLWNDSGRLFTTWDGKPMTPDTASIWFAKFVKTNDLPFVTFHGLRHTNVSLLIANGVDVRTIASRVGHSNPSTTLNLYSHMLKKSDQMAADGLEQRIMGSKKTTEHDDPDE